MCGCGARLLLCVVIVSVVILLVTSFNIDTFNYVHHKGPEQSMFGFSVATHKEYGRSWVIVGAPTSQGQQSRIHRGGVVFKCSSTADNGCEEVDFHQERSGERGRPLDDKNNQWFGATINSAGPDGPVVACAPRYVWFTNSREERRDPVGTCYIAKDDFRTFSEYSPCRTSLFGYHRQGSCQAGFSAGISKDGQRLFVGAPGSWYWQGQMYSIDPMVKFPFTPGIFGEAFGFGSKGQVIQQSLYDRPAVVSTPEGPAKDDDSYMGYSMIVGDFNGEGVQGIAVGMPKGGEFLEGKVLLYTWNLTNYLNITGRQLGSYFGYSLATSDIDGDRRDDLIIGAPMHAEPNTEHKYEVGRIYVAYQGLDGNYKNQFYIDGFRSKSRFGLSLCTLGDMNLDGYGDFAVGAPYDGPNEAGAVYIFQGSAKGVVSKYSQVIFAEEVQKAFGSFYPLSTFGFSLAGGLDLDGNDYPDLAIGAYLSDTAYFFRARPVVKVNAQIHFLPHNIKAIKLEEKNCTKPGSPLTWVSCVQIEVCMNYTGIGTPSRIELNVHYNLDAQKAKYSRMYLDRDNGKRVNKTVTLYKDAPLDCSQLRHMVYLEEQIVDKLTDLEIEMSYSLNETGYYQQHNVRNPNSILIPIVDLTTPATANASISIYKNCGHDNICIPDLQLIVNRTVDKYLYEIGKSLEFNIIIVNTEDDSYNTKFNVQLPKGITYKIASRDDGSILSCSNSLNQSIFVCDVGNPLPKGGVVRFKLEVEPLAHQKLLQPTYDFYMNVTSANPEDSSTLYDNSHKVSVDIWVNAILVIEGKSTPTNVYYDTSQYATASKATWDHEVGPSVIHSYTVTNTGPSDVEEVEIFIIWPMATLGGEDLLYLREPPHTLGGVKCDAVDTNYRGYTLQLQKNVWDVIGIDKGTNFTGTGGFLTETGPPQIGQTGNTITETVTTVVFYDANDREVHRLEIISEPGSDEYWRKILESANQFGPSLKVAGNSSSLVTTYVDGKMVDQKVVNRHPDVTESRFANFKINSNVTTVIRYYRGANNLLYKETIHLEPGSEEYLNRIKIKKEEFGQPLTIETETVKEIKCVSHDGVVLRKKTLTHKGKESVTGVETSTTSVITTVTFYSSDNKVLHTEIIQGEPLSQIYWERVNKIISGFQEPVTISTNSTKIVTYFVNGKETHKQEKPVSVQPQLLSITTNVEVVTEIIVKNAASGYVLFQDTIQEEKGSPAYNKYINDIITRYQEPIIVVTKTIYTITYQNSKGEVIRTGSITESREQPYDPSQITTSRTSTITTIAFYDIHGNKLHQEEIFEEPDSPEYWEKINKITSAYQKQRQQQITIRISTRTVITYYINGQVARTENKGQRDSSYTSQSSSASTTVIIYNNKREVLYKGVIPAEKGSDTYKRYIDSLVARFREPIIVIEKTTYTILYRNSEGRVVYTGTVSAEETHTYNQQITQTSKTRIVTTIIFYGPNRNIVHRETIPDEPGSTAYWERIKSAISNFNFPINIHTNSSKIITYYINGVESKSEQVANNAGLYEHPFSSHLEIVNIITYYDSSKRVLHQDTVNGELNAEERSRRIAEFTKRYGGSFTMETNTTKTITYRTSDGRILYRDAVLAPIKSGEQSLTRTITETTFTVYGPDRRTILHQETIQAEPGSAPYNNAIANIISRFTGSITIYTNSTKTVTFYNAEGRPIDQQSVAEPHSTVQRDGGESARSATTITFYGPNGQPIHHDTISGAPGPELYDQLNQIAREYGGVVKSYGGQANEDGSIGGAVTYVDTPYPGGKSKVAGQHFTEYDNSHDQGQSQWSSGFNQSYHYNAGQQGGNHRYGGSVGLQDLGISQQDLGSFAKNKGFRTGGIDLGVGGGAVDEAVDGKARSSLETFSENQSYDGSHNYLSGVKTHRYETGTNRLSHGKKKREVDSTEDDIRKLSNCATSKCIRIRCVTGPIRNRQEVHIALRARVNVQTLKNISTTQSVNIQSMLLARISHFQTISGLPAQRTLYRQQAVTSVTPPSPVVKPDIVPLWVVILSAVAGTLILLLLIFLLHKCGFFNRNRPSDAPERQPLNRNGHFQHGDEAL